ncbi:ABC transporter ATP-binding protein [Gordonia oleivorans]|uniref:ABC transporter ATP-binding protein n=1 Tax=Gordonia oleivorans TaxID=3156618 RepID=UPI003CCD572F
MAHDVSTAILLRAENIGVELAGVRVLDDVSLTARSGRMTGVSGPSGAGKTTLLRALAGLVPLCAGAIDYVGQPNRRPGEIGMLAQHPRLVANPRWTLRRIVAEPATIGGRDIDVAEVADEVGLDRELLDRFPAEVSDGQLQRACLGRLVVGSPSIVLCDEPTAMLDPVAARVVIEVLASIVDRGAAMVLVSHQRALIEARCADVLELGVGVGTG